ncbi:DUF4290 domain-containing protein [bacterium]|nr:DUF4290 domain-containing protein [bacterium]
MELSYHTQKEKIILEEYGRSIQEMVAQLNDVEDRDKRNRMARTIVQAMIHLNPEVKQLDDYEKTLWDHLHIMGKYELDIDGKFEKPAPEKLMAKPEPIGYKDVLTRYRFYGRNLIEMIDGAKELPDGELKTSYINYIASFMVNSSNNWNDEVLTPNQVAQHMSDLSGGALQLNPEDLNIHHETRKKRPAHKSNNNKKKKKFRRR